MGEAGRAVAALLLGTQELTSGEVFRHEDLNVVHLTPQNKSDVVESHVAFIADALAKRPQIVVVDKCSALSSDAWLHACSRILQGPDISKFQGGIVICSADDEDMAQEFCSTRWMATGLLLKAEDMNQGIKLFDDVCASNSDFRSNRAPVLDQVQELWEENFGDFNDVALFLADYRKPDLLTLAEAKGWKIAVLAEEGGSADLVSDVDPCIDVDHNSDADAKHLDKNGTSELLGYLAYEMFPGIGELHIERLAVPKQHRRLGYATQLIRWACKRASVEGLSSVWLYAKPDVEEFYERIGFFNMGYADDPSLSLQKEDKDRYAWMMLDLRALLPSQHNVMGVEG